MWTFIEIGALLLVCCYFGALYNRAKAKKLPRNSLTGLRTRAIMSSDEIWAKTHQKYALVFLLACLCFGAAALVLVISPLAETTRSVLVTAIMVLTLIIMITFGYKADRYAKQLEKQ